MRRSVGAVEHRGLQARSTENWRDWRAVAARHRYGQVWHVLHGVRGQEVSGEGAVRSPSALPFVALNGHLKIARVGQVVLLALQRVQILGVPENEIEIGDQKTKVMHLWHDKG